MSKTVLQMVQQILNDMDSEPVNSLTDSLEAEQVASILSETFDDIVYTEDLPEHRELLKLTAVSDTDNPTEFLYADNVVRIHRVWYDVQDNSPASSAREYREVIWVDPLEFLDRMDVRNALSAEFTAVIEAVSGTVIRVYNDRHPTMYTSFDNKRIIMDSHNKNYDNTLQESKVRAYGSVIPVFDKNDGSAVVDLDPAHTQYLLKEATGRCFDLLKGGTTPKLEQSTRKVRYYLQNDRYRTVQDNIRPDYGRK